MIINYCRYFVFFTNSDNWYNFNIFDIFNPIMFYTLGNLKWNKNFNINYIYMKHKSEDYKISAVKYYLKNKVSMDKVCNIFFGIFCSILNFQGCKVSIIQSYKYCRPCNIILTAQCRSAFIAWRASLVQPRRWR
jgi:hypothetical protein